MPHARARRFVCRLVAVAATLALVGAACGPSTSAGYSSDSGDKLTAYVLAAGSGTYNITANASGTFGIGASLEAWLPSAVKSALSLIGTSLKFQMNYNAQADVNIATTSTGQTIKLTYKSLTGHVSVPVPGQSKDVSLQTLANGATVTVTYVMDKNGTVTTQGKDPVADTFWLAEPPISSCPALPSGGANSGQTWTSQTQPGGLLSYVTTPVQWTGNYNVANGTGTVKLTSTNLGGLQVSTNQLIDTLNKALNLQIPPLDVTGSLAATGSLQQSCGLSVPAQTLLTIAPNTNINGQLNVGGTSLPAGLKPGTLLQITLTSQTTTKQS